MSNFAQMNTDLKRKRCPELKTFYGIKISFIEKEIYQFPYSQLKPKNP